MFVEDQNDEESAVQITNKSIVIFSDKNFENEEKEISIETLEALYLNSKHDQVIFKTEELPNPIFTSDKAKSAVGTILSLVNSKKPLVYLLPDEDIINYVTDSEFPDQSFEYKVPAFSKKANEDSSEIGHQITETGKVQELVGDKEEVKGEKITENQDGNDSSGSSESEPEFDGAETDLARNKSKCMITKVTLDNFSLLKVIGEGAFGRVFLTKNDEGDIFAMKRIRKDKVLRSDAVENILLERKILTQINHPLLLGLKHVFSSDYRFYFFCDYVVGGDLMRHLNKTENGFALSQVKFLAAQVVLAIECLHENKIVHRDLKPENVLIDEEGYIRLADFGLAKDLNEGEGKGSCGTLEYMAPEVVNSTKGHNFEVDWWTLGILMYELYYKKTPFLAGSRKEILDNIVNKELEFPEKPGEKSDKNFKNFKSIVTKLLKKD